MRRTTYYGDCTKCGGSGKLKIDGWQATALDAPCDRCLGAGRVITHVTDESPWPWPWSFPSVPSVTRGGT